jgi:hypothetical protein
MSPAQGLPEVSGEGIEINVLHRHTEVIVTVLSGASFGLTDIEPVSCLVADALEAVAFDKGLSHVDGMTVFVHPILPDASKDPAKNMTGQMRNTNPGQDEEAGIVGHEYNVLSSCFRLPSDEDIARCTLPCCGTEEEAGQVPTGAIPNQVLYIFSNSSVEPDVVISAQVISHTTLIV